MKHWILLLRGINVGGKNRLPMKELTLVLEKVGCTGVATYIQSGNIVLTSHISSKSRLSELISNTILNAYGFEPKVHLLLPRQLEAAVVANPFPDAVSNPKSLHLFFLSKSPSTSGLEMLETFKSDTEDLSLVMNTLYLHAPDGIGRSRLVANIEKTLDVDVTARNWRTVVKLLDLSKQTQ